MAIVRRNQYPEKHPVTKDEINLHVQQFKEWPDERTDEGAAVDAL